MLLQMVGALEQLKYQSNVSAALRSGRYEGIGKTSAGSQLERLGRMTLEKLDIRCKKDFDRGWATRVLTVSDLSFLLEEADFDELD